MPDLRVTGGLWGIVKVRLETNFDMSVPCQSLVNTAAALSHHRRQAQWPVAYLGAGAEIFYARGRGAGHARSSWKTTLQHRRLYPRWRVPAAARGRLPILPPRYVLPLAAVLLLVLAVAASGIVGRAAAEDEYEMEGVTVTADAPGQDPGGSRMVRRTVRRARPLRPTTPAGPPTPPAGLASSRCWPRSCS